MHGGSPERRGAAHGARVRALEGLLLFLALLAAARLFQLQIWEGKNYGLLAANQHELEELLIPVRGRILVRDRADGSLHPIATNRDAWTLYAVPREMDDPGAVAREVAPFTSLTEAELVERWSAHPDDPYDLLARGLTTEQSESVASKRIPGVGLVKGWARYYPERNMGGQLIGFVRTDDTGIGEGSYGIEGGFDEVLRGRPGEVSAQKDAGGRRLMLGGGSIRHAVDGSDVILTIDRTVQYETCTRLEEAVKRYDADGGTVIIMNPHSGAILAMCSSPDFDPANYGSTEDLSAFNNPATFAVYEPGSVFKPFTIALGIDRGKITPETLYEDKGVEVIDEFEIKNSNEKANGWKTMTEVLEESLNTGTIFVERLLGREAFKDGVLAFGFGEKSGVELTPEAKGNASALSKKADVYGATISFGQGISVTPIQLIRAFAALGNGGELIRPYVVEEVVRPDGTRERTDPKTDGRPISARTSKLLTGMLVSVVERGHAKKAGVPGYYVAGKTGTAQVANPRGPGYLEGVQKSTFVGYAPADDPAFIMLVKLDNPRAGKWADSTAAPLWSDIARFLLAYLEIPFERDLSAPREVDTVPDLPATLSGALGIVSVDVNAAVPEATSTVEGTNHAETND
jgi:cell division protein FtsI/penicillin-binding protein 2